MKRLGIIIGILAISYFVLFFGDVLLKEATTDQNRNQAALYLHDQGLPIPNRPFTRDGCTAFPDSLLFHDLYEPCLNHDIAYWAGGEDTLRYEADYRLYEEVIKTGPLGIVIAPIMYYAVAYFGNNWVSHMLGSEWGFGWSDASRIPYM